MTLEEFFALEEHEESLRPPLRLGIVGSRDWPEERKEFFVREVLAMLKLHPSINTIVSGGQAKGVDGWAMRIARHFGMKPVEHLPAHYLPKNDPRYLPYSPGHYHARNEKIAQDSDLILAFRHKMSGGTSSTIRYAQKLLPPERVIIHDWPLRAATTEPIK
jgi:thiamine pyrophosphate-dependent acetolactate synthase large subunit-like protein